MHLWSSLWACYWHTVHFITSFFSIISISIPFMLVSLIQHLSFFSLPLCSLLFNLLSLLFPAGGCHRESVLIFLFVCVVAAWASGGKTPYSSEKEREAEGEWVENGDGGMYSQKEVNKKEKKSPVIFIRKWWRDDSSSVHSIHHFSPLRSPQHIMLLLFMASYFPLSSTFPESFPFAHQ